jgi:hypothetical protein
MVLAHAGHWLVSLLYLAPVLIVVLALGWQSRRDKRTGRSADGETDEPSLDDIMDGKKRRG